MKINRKKFFLISSTSFLGIALLKSLPFSPFAKKEKSGEGKLKVKITPSAVSRNSKEGTNA
jgi:hypothetical protein